MRGLAMVLMTLGVVSVSFGACGSTGGDAGDGSDGSDDMISDNGDAPDAAAAEPEPSSCPHQGPPVIDPASLPACQCAGAHCLPATFVGADLAADLAACEANPASLCVPDPFIASAGEFIPATCKSLLGAEGRCLSVCLPRIAEQAGVLPRDACAETEVCAPCFDPTTGQDTGACRVSCDPGPIEPPMMFATCCHDDGQCVPPEAAGDHASDLGPDTCPAGLLCAPDVFVGQDYVAAACSTVALASIFGDAYKPGACMPDCLPAVSNFILGQDGCLAGFKCAPCLDPLSGQPTGACEFLPP